MLADDRARGQALGPGGQDVVLAQDFEHGRAHEAREPGQRAKGINENGQGQVAGQIHGLAPKRKLGEIHGGQAGNGQYGPVDAEEQHEQQGQPESGHGKADEHQDRGRPVEQAALPVGRQEPDGDGDAQRQEKRRDVHGEGQGQPFADLVPDGPMVAGQGLAEVEPNEFAEPVHILDGQGPIESVEFLEPGAGFGRGQRVEGGLHIRGRARSQMNDREADQRDTEEDAGDPKGFEGETFGQIEHGWRTP